MACTGVVKITHSDNEKFGLLELGQFLVWVCAPYRAWLVLFGIAGLSACPRCCLLERAAPKAGFAFKINWPFVGDHVLSMMKILNVLIMQLETDPQRLCTGVLNVTVSRKGIG